VALLAKASLADVTQLGFLLPLSRHPGLKPVLESRNDKSVCIFTVHKNAAKFLISVKRDVCIFTVHKNAANVSYLLKGTSVDLFCRLFDNNSRGQLEWRREDGRVPNKAKLVSG
jgi:hypothetical protein